MKNDYSKEVKALKVTARWLKTWVWFWIFYKVIGSEPPVPLYCFAALYVVVAPILDLAIAPVNRWLEQRWPAYRLRREAR